MSQSETLTELEAILKRKGYSDFWHNVGILRRRRLQVQGREKRVQLSPAKKQKLYDAQKGICPLCEKNLLVPARLNATDHINPTAQDFNDWRNLQLVHPSCNSSKGADSVMAQSKKCANECRHTKCDAGDGDKGV